MKAEKAGKTKVAQDLQRVLSPEACAWLEGKQPMKAKETSSKTVAPPQDMPPSMEKLMFAASEAPIETESPVQDEEGAIIDDGERFLLGTLVELRR